MFLSSLSTYFSKKISWVWNTPQPPGMMSLASFYVIKMLEPYTNNNNITITETLSKCNG